MKSELESFCPLIYYVEIQGVIILPTQTNEENTKGNPSKLPFALFDPPKNGFAFMTPVEISCKSWSSNFSNPKWYIVVDWWGRISQWGK